MQCNLSAIRVLPVLVLLAFAHCPGSLRAEDRAERSLVGEICAAESKGQWHKASDAAIRWAAWRAKRYGAQSRELAEAHERRAQIFARAGEHDKAAEAFGQEIAILRVSPGPHSKALGEALMDFAGAKSAQGRSSEAITAFRQALEIFEVDPVPADALTAYCLNRLSLLLLYRRAFHEAEPLMRRAFEIREKLYGDAPHAEMAASLGNLGLLYFEMGAYDDAKEHLIRALKIYDRLSARDANNVLGASNTRRTLGSLYADRGHYADAEEVLEQARNEIQTRFGKKSLELAEAMVTLAEVQAQNVGGGKLGDAEKGFKTALAIQRSHSPPPKPDTVLQTKISLATCLAYQGKAKEALQILKEVLKVCEKNPNVQHPRTPSVVNNIGMVTMTLRQTVRARECADQLLKLLSGSLENVFANFPENRRLGFVQKFGLNPYDLAATIGDGPLAADAVLTFKGAVLDSVARDRRRALLARESGSAGLVQQIDNLRDQFLGAQLAGDAVEIKKLATHLDEQEKELSQRLRQQGTYRPLQRVGWGNVAARLPDNALLLEFICYKKHLGGAGGWKEWIGAVALGRDRQPVFKELGPAEPIQTRIGEYRDIASGRTAKGSKTEDLGSLDRPIETVCRALFKSLLEPFAGLLPTEGGQLFISPDGWVGLVSFATLLDQEDHFVGDRFRVCYVDSGRVFLDSSETGPRLDEAPSRKIVLVGDPDFGGSSDMPQGETADGGLAYRDISGEELRDAVAHGIPALRAVRFDPLPGTGMEIEALESAFRENGWQTQSLRGPAAREADLRKVCGGAQILHIATHGYFMPEFTAGAQARVSNPMFRGWLALTGANATLQAWERGEVPPAANDGILTAAEATSLDLSKTELVILSACGTANGQVQSGEGVLGLHRGFALAGAQNLLLTAWRIKDDYSAEFMKKFYEAVLGGADPSAALHKVQAAELARLRKQQGTFNAVHLSGPFMVTSLRIGRDFQGR